MERIINLLEQINSGDCSKILELSRELPQEVVDVALKEKLYDALLKILSPIKVDGKIIICIDGFSTDILDRIHNACDTVEEAENRAREDYSEIQKKSKIYGDLNDELSSGDYLTYEEILSSYDVIPRDIKEAIKDRLFHFDIDLVQQIKIKDSHARMISGIGHPISSINDVVYYSEPACLEACIDLFGKNIKTTMNDTDGVIEDSSFVENPKCFIACDYTSLSDENKKIFDELIQQGISERYMDGDIDTVSITVSCDNDETVGEVSQKLLSIVSKLKYQDILYGRQSLEDFYENHLTNYARIFSELYKKHFEKKECSWDDVIAFAEDLGYYYDSEEDILWNSKHLYDVHMEYKNYTKYLEDEQRYSTHFENGVESVMRVND